MAEKGELGMSESNERKEYEFISKRELNKKLDVISENLGMTREEMRVTKVRDEHILRLIEFISQDLFRTSVEQLEDQVTKLLVYLKRDEFLSLVVDVFEFDLSRLRGELGANVVTSFSEVMGCEFESGKNSKREVTIDDFSENAIRSYAKYIFDVNNEIIDIYSLLSENSPKDFNPHHHVRKRRIDNQVCMF